MNRGSDSSYATRDESESSFNEAPIHESGKCAYVDLGAGHTVASMRPRFMNRGSYFWTLAFFQLIHGFNEAPIHESGKSEGPKALLRGPWRFNEAPIHESGKLQPC